MMTGQPNFRNQSHRWSNFKHLIGFLLLEIFLVGCSTTSTVSSAEPETSKSSQPSINVTLGQSLPISAQVKLANQVIQLEVARTQEQQAIGLMYRTRLDANRGMLFPFNPPRRVSFWMKNVSINLDMVFLLKGRIVGITSNVSPCLADPCPLYGPDTLVDQVIELRGGRAAELGLKVGDRLAIQNIAQRQ